MNNRFKLLVVSLILCAIGIAFEVNAKPLDAYCSKVIKEVDVIQSIDWSPEVEDILYYLRHYNSWHDIKDEIYGLRKKLYKEYRKAQRKQSAKCSSWRKRQRNKIKKIVVKPKKITIYH